MLTIIAGAVHLFPLVILVVFLLSACASSSASRCMCKVTLFFPFFLLHYLFTFVRCFLRLVHHRVNPVCFASVAWLFTLALSRIAFGAVPASLAMQISVALKRAELYVLSSHTHQASAARDASR